MKKYSNGILMDMSAEEIQAHNDFVKKYNEDFEGHLLGLRIRRNQLLAKTDWTANSDVTMSAEMKEYRQKLRDAPSGLDTVEKVLAYEFPTEVTK
mgnify:FL=1|tara:strand:- start:60 stop:344 length:285 start_codon:yes stop_codon:yes gene_type:complete